MSTLHRALYLSLFAGAVLAACSEEGASTSHSPTESDPCVRLAQCCDTLSAPVAAQCRSTLESYGGRAEAPDACRSALTTFERSGTCGEASVAGDGGSTPTPSGSPRAICDAYIACIGGTTPEGLGAIVATYGPNGSCWTTGNEALCLEACRTGLKNARKAFPDAKACPECLGASDCTSSSNGTACDTKTGRCVECTSDTSCGGQKPACNVAKSACVACTTNAHCATNGGGTCDVATNECVRCTSDAQCSAPTPRCKKAPGQKPACVACLTGADCTTGACTDNKCCQPESCGELKSMMGINPATWVCGNTYSTKCSGATVQCGGCSKGTCKAQSSFSRCSLEDTPCTPGVSGTCMNDEVCTYVPNKSAYVCAHDIRGSTCAYGGESYKCNNYHFSCDGANLVTNGKCRAYCKTSVDCAAGETCGVYPDLGYGVCK